MSLFSLGDGLYGGTGHGDTSFYLSPTQISTLESLPERSYPLGSIAAGWAHSAAVSADGNVLVWGQPFELRNVLRLRRTATTSGRMLASILASVNEWLTPSLNKDNRGILGASSVPKWVEGLPPGEVALQVSCGAGLTAIRCESGALFLFGLNSFGQCGVGVESSTEFTPTRALGALDPVSFRDLPRFPPGSTPGERAEATRQRRLSAQNVPPLSPGQRVVDVSLGFQHGACATAAGAVLTWGKGERGQLGLGEVENTPFPTRVCLEPDHGSFWAQRTEERGANIAIAEGEEVVGSEVQAEEYSPPPSSPRAVSVKCGFNHTACLTADGDVYVWGKMQSTVPKDEAADGGAEANRPSPGFLASLDAELGVRTYEDQLAPRRLNIPCRAVEIACSAFHTAVRLEDGSVVAQGMRIGSRKMEPHPVPLEIPVPLEDSVVGDDVVGGGDGLQFDEVSAALRTLEGSTVTCVRGGPAASSTLVVDSRGAARTVFFGDPTALHTTALSGALTPSREEAEAGGELPPGLFSWPRSPQQGAPTVVDGALGWQHSILKTK